MKIGIIVAMEKELQQLKTLLSDLHTEQRNHKEFIIGSMNGHVCIVQKCGIGKVNAAIGAVEMIDGYRPDIVVSSGVAGGADIALNVTEVVVGTEYVYHDAYCGSECAYGQLQGLPARFAADAKALAALGDEEGGVRIHKGLIVSGDWFVDSREKMTDILAKFPDAKAVDMESCAIAHTCHVYGVPFVSIRIISDVPLKDTKAAQYFDFWQTMADGSFTVTKALLSSLHD